MSTSWTLEASSGVDAVLISRRFSLGPDLALGSGMTQAAACPFTRLQQRVVAPFITDVVGDVARPRRALTPCRDLAHLPGEGGVLAGIANLAGWTRRGNAHLVEQHQRFGPVFRTRLGPTPIVCVSDAEMLVRIMRNEDQAWSAALAWSSVFRGIDPTSPTIGSVSTLDFEQHRQARQLLQPAFGAAAIAGYLDDAIPAIEAAVDGWIRRGRVPFKSEIRRLLANVSLRIFLGIENEDDGAFLDCALADVWRGPLAVAKNPWISPGWRRAMRGYRTLQEWLRPQVAARRARGGTDLFSRLCVEAGRADLDDEAMLRLFIGVMLGAFDTTSSGLSSMAYLLAKHSTWQDRLRDQASSLGFPRLRYDDVKRLEATDRVWKETLRLFPIAADVPRYTLRDVDLGGHRIPAGTFVLAMMGPVMQDPAWWTEPARFDPDRFLEPRAEDRKHKGLFLPFGSGAHACIGTHLANVEVRAFWHTMLTRARFSLKRDYEAHHAYDPLGMVSGDVELVVERI